MKKKAVLIILFILPLVVYLFFATGVNSFIKLPTLTEKIADVNPNWKSLNGEKVTLNDKITILGFSGENIMQNRGNFFLLNQKIYNRNKEFKDFQIVFISPDGTQDKVKSILERLDKLTDTKGYHFVFAKPEEIKEFFKTMKLVGQLNDNFGSPNVYIIDKQRNLRGRKGKSVQGKPEYREGYNVQSSAELHNEMTDDLKIILAEYRLALKKNNRKDAFRDKITKEVETKIQQNEK
jgi:cytochrome oxidase Cu insertion factor (SCO1/SenC/PrrC family)